jgi:hypothetical protein
MEVVDKIEIRQSSLDRKLFSPKDLPDWEIPKFLSEDIPHSRGVI